jgi:hypothetical protein
MRTVFYGDIITVSFDAKILQELFCDAIVIQHYELGRRPSQPAFPGKVDRESGCGFQEATKRATASTLQKRRVFFSFSY